MARQRRPRFKAVCPCKCAACVEREQLHRVAALSVLPVERIVAVSFLGMLDAIDNGVYGGVAVENLFD